MTQHRYPITALAGDYCRAAVGVVLAIPPLIVLPLNPYVAGIFALLGALFLVFGGRTLLRQLAPLEMNERAIARTGLLPVELAWSALDELKLAYFATRRDGAGGWMQLGLRAGRRRLRLDSRIEGFAAIVERAVAAATARQLPLSPTTMTNLAALGVGPAAGR
jgi:hypothetical protein